VVGVASLARGLADVDGAGGGEQAGDDAYGSK
jgi:hypothetical protein